MSELPSGFNENKLNGSGIIVCDKCQRVVTWGSDWGAMDQLLKDHKLNSCDHDKIASLEKALAAAKEALEDSIAPINFANQESSPPYYYDPVLNKVNEAISKIMGEQK